MAPQPWNLQNGGLTPRMSILLPRPLQSPSNQGSVTPRRFQTLGPKSGTKFIPAASVAHRKTAPIKFPWNGNTAPNALKFLSHTADEQAGLPGHAGVTQVTHSREFGKTLRTTIQRKRAPWGAQFYLPYRASQAPRQEPVQTLSALTRLLRRLTLRAARLA